MPPLFTIRETLQTSVLTIVFLYLRYQSFKNTREVSEDLNQSATDLILGANSGESRDLEGVLARLDLRS